FSAPVDDLPGLYVADLESGQTTRLYDSQITYAEWSPDGSRVFFSVLMQNNDSTWFEEWLVNADGQTPAHVLSRDAIWNYNRAAWSPDGSLLAYWGNSGLFLYDVQAGESCRLIDGTDFDWQGAR
ncbi:MAG: PD40 domain-containing protein, partial [Anaerolineae bacterium]|nr:PD40 domain-containing protein [Anaerolineae bacterium]